MSGRWICKMAWRDSRASRSRLFLYLSSISLGIAALVAISSFGANLRQAVDDQAKSLLGADLEFSSRGPFSEEALELIRTLGGQQARRTSFSSMAFFPLQEATRLVEVRAVDDGFPFYGDLETAPSEAATQFQRGPHALVDNNLLLQFGVKVGEVIKLGDFNFTVAGRLLRVPGESTSLSSLGARVYIPSEYLDETGLIQLGSRVDYDLLLKFEPGVDVAALLESHQETIERLRLRTSTVEERRRRLGRSLENLNRFLSLVAFVALILGGIGVASSIHLYVKQRVDTVAILRCVGSTPRQSFSIYLAQSAAMGLLGAAAGALLGVGIQFSTPWFLGGILPVELDLSVSWFPILQGVGIGLGVALLFALIPLAPIRKISPLRTLRADLEPPQSRDDWLVWSAYGLIAAALFVFSLAQTSRLRFGLGFFFGVIVVFGLLLILAKAIMFTVRRYFPSGWRYEFRQGLANLYRPHNQTVVLMLALGLGTFFVATLYITQLSLLEELALFNGDDKPNLILFDIQSDQKAGVRRLVEQTGTTVLEEVPIVTMRLQALKGRPAEEILSDDKRTPSRWALRREYRCTYRAELDDTEQLVAGELQARAGEDDIRVSLEEGLARSLDVRIGDEITFDVQGIAVKAEIGSLRKVDWDNFQTNFFIVFPPGVLEEAPQFHVTITRAHSARQSAQVQRSVVQTFPNVSALDLALVLQTVNAVIDKVVFVIRFMALFTVITGLIVLTGAIVSGRYQRMKESVLLRTLGASRKQIRKILFMEHLFLGIMASSAGLLLALVAGWNLTYFVFEVGFAPALAPVLAILLMVVFLTVAVGLFNSRGLYDHPPLEILRAEG